MTQFSLQEYLKNPNRKIVTKDGRPARILCFDSKDGQYPIIALIDKGYQDSAFRYTVKGEVATGFDKNLNLMMLPEKKYGWINLYRYEQNIGAGKVYKSEEEAQNSAVRTDRYIATAKIEWEE